MRPVKVLIFGIDDWFPKLKPFYDKEVEKGNLEIVGYADLQGDKIKFTKTLNGTPLHELEFDKIIISSRNDFMPKYKRWKEFFNKEIGGGYSLTDVIDGRVFQIPNLDLQKLCDEGIAHIKLSDDIQNPLAYCGGIYSVIHPKYFTSDKLKLKIKIGITSYCGAKVERNGLIQIGNYSPLSWGLTFSLNLNANHNHFRTALHSYWSFPFKCPDDYKRRFKQESKLIFGNDVWVGRGNSFVISNPDKSINIGDGAIIASNSVVIHDVPPYAIYGGNPAKFIKWRFDRETIESLERIKWWNWDIEKIYNNFKYFYNPVEFAKKFDPLR